MVCRDRFRSGLRPRNVHFCLQFAGVDPGQSGEGLSQYLARSPLTRSISFCRDISLMFLCLLQKSYNITFIFLSHYDKGHSRGQHKAIKLRTSNPLGSHFCDIMDRTDLNMDSQTLKTGLKTSYLYLMCFVILK